MVTFPEYTVLRGSQEKRVISLYLVVDVWYSVKKKKEKK